MNIFWVSVILAWLTNAFGQRVDQTPRTAAKETGESLTINCVLTGSGYALHSTSWFRQNPGTTDWERMSIGGRYVESVNKGAKSFSLRIKDLTAEDSATYYCKAADPPIISLLYSATDELRAKGFVQLVCLISEYQPESIGVSWEKNGNAIRSGFTTSSPAKDSNGDFSSTSLLKVPLQEWASGSVYSCQVSHSPTNSNQRKEIRSTSELAVFLRDPSLEEIWINKTATLVCEVFSTLPTEAAITWTVGGKMRTEGVLFEPATKSGDQYLTIGRLTSSVKEWESGAEYSCSAQEGQSSTVVSTRTGKAKVEPVKPKLRLLPPSPAEIRSTSAATLTCLIRGFYPDIITISWEKDGAALSANVTSFPTALEQDLTFSTRSLLSLPSAEWKRGSTYTCSASHPPSQSTVKGAISSPKELAVFLRDPSLEEIWINKTATLVCEVVSTLPTEAAITWTVGGKMRTEGVLTKPATKSGDQYLTIGRVTSSVEEWESGAEYTCSAQEGQSSTVVSTRTGKAKVEPVKPKLRLLPPSPVEIRSTSAATLTCLISGFYPGIITVSWEKDGAALSANVTSFPTALEQDLTFSTRSLLSLPSAEWKRGSTYTCAASHPPSQSTVKGAISSPKDDCHGADISVNILNPPFEEIWTQRTATIVCEVVYSELENVSVSWQVGGSRRTEGVETRTPEWSGSKSAIVSKLKVTAAEWDSGAEYLCFVEDSELPTPVKISTRKVKVGEMHPPKVYVLPPSADEIDTEKTATLVCLVSGFYPAEIYIAWMANDTLLDSASPSQPDTENETGSSSIGSRLMLTAAEWNSGTTYSCLVGHPSLKMNLIRSINKSHGKPTLVNVSLVLTDSFTSCT